MSGLAQMENQWKGMVSQENKPKLYVIATPSGQIQRNQWRLHAIPSSENKSDTVDNTQPVQNGTPSMQWQEEPTRRIIM